MTDYEAEQVAFMLLSLPTVRVAELNDSRRLRDSWLAETHQRYKSSHKPKRSLDTEWKGLLREFRAAGISRQVRAIARKRAGLTDDRERASLAHAINQKLDRTRAVVASQCVLSAVASAILILFVCFREVVSTQVAGIALATCGGSIVAGSVVCALQCRQALNLINQFHRLLYDSKD